MSEILNMYGDGIGYVKLVESMGDSHTPAEDARMSTDKGRLGPEKDNALQERLLKDSHTSPFEGVVVKFEICAPLFVIRELDRHRTVDKNSEDDPFEIVLPEEGMRKFMSRNEMSGRYIQMPDMYYHPATVRGQSKTNKQGGGNEPISPEVAAEFYTRGMEITRSARELYTWAIEQGIEKGMARIYNTQNQYTKIRYTGSLKNWCDVMYLRLPSAVLWECRLIARNVRQLLEEKFPDPVSSWEKLVYSTARVNKDEMSMILTALNILDNYDGDLSNEEHEMKNRLREKLEAKMNEKYK